MFPPEALGRDCSSTLPGSTGRQHSFICSPIIPMPVTVVTQPSPLLLGNSAYVPPIRIYVVARRIHWDKLLTYLKILNAIISAKSVTTT